MPRIGKVRDFHGSIQERQVSFGLAWNGLKRVVFFGTHLRYTIPQGPIFQMLKEKQIYQSWKKRFGYPGNFYEREADQGFAKVRTLKFTTKNEILRKIHEHRLILIGDDALAPFHKLQLMSLLSSAKGKSRALITNRFGKNFQKNDEMKALWKFLKRKKIHMITIDEASNLKKEEDSFLQSVKKNWEKYDQLILWTGHIRLASKRFQNKFSEFYPLHIYLQCNHLRWKFPKTKAWNMFGDANIVHLDTSPLASLDFFRIFEAGQESISDSQKIIQQYRKTTEKIAGLLGQKTIFFPRKILHVFDSESLDEINRLKSKKRLYRFLSERIMKGESAAIPGEKLVLLSTLEKSHIAEEAAHFLRTANHNIKYGKNAIILEEALAFFASLLVIPERKIPKGKQSMSMWDEIHWMGYVLGFRLWKCWNRSTNAKILIRKLWNLHPRNEREALDVLQIMEKMK